jgi:hypothetical protein
MKKNNFKLIMMYRMEMGNNELKCFYSHKYKIRRQIYTTLHKNLTFYRAGLLSDWASNSNLEPGSSHGFLRVLQTNISTEKVSDIMKYNESHLLSFRLRNIA